MRIVLITANQRRHRYAAAELERQLGLAGVVSEEKFDAAAETAASSSADRDVIRRHFAERDVVEQKMLGEPADFPAYKLLRIQKGAVNDPRVCAWIEAHRPDLVLLYGTGLLRAPLLERLGDRIVNLHLGLSPYYRGAGTNFWPLVYGEPECIGATIHLAVAKVDAGPVYHQVRPHAELGDRSHELGTKALREGVSGLVTVAEAWAGGHLEGRTQDLAVGRVFRLRDFNADAIVRMWANLEAGMVDRYVPHQAERTARFPIQTLETADSQDAAGEAAA